MEQKSNLDQTSKYFSENDINFLKMINANTANLMNSLSDNNSKDDKILKKESVGSEKNK